MKYLALGWAFLALGYTVILAFPDEYGAAFVSILLFWAALVCFAVVLLDIPSDRR